MSEYVETLNRWGESFLGFAWPMLWQSSLLIAAVFLFDWVFARRIRASARYALWMVMLVKLILPPALALPTGVTWWLWRPHPVVEPAVITHYTVSFSNPVPTFSPPTTPLLLPPPKLSTDARVLLAATVIAVVFLSYLAFRWLRVAGKVRQAAAAPAELNSLLDEARQLAGLRRHPRLKLIDDAQSPAVYGLFRPVILLPRTLANQLSVRQLRAVLLHESVHLRRYDVWVNCAQTLLQIAYWWHPLLWLANIRIRRLREEAVDDAVMLALREGADAYAPTLLEVAKFAFRRPLASLGLVGILESRSALRQRVERLIDFRPPRRAGVTFLSLCGIFAFSAVALPMGQGPAATIDSDSIQRASASTEKNVSIEGDFFWMTDNDFNSVVAGTTYQNGRNGAAPVWTADPAQLKGINWRIKGLGLQAFGRPRIETVQGRTGELYIGNLTNWIQLNCEPDVYGANVVLNFKAESGSVSIQNGLETTNRLEIYSKPTVDDDGAVVVRAPNPDGSASNLVVVLNVKIVSSGRATTTPAVEMRSFGVGRNVFLANLGKNSETFVSEAEISINDRTASDSASGINFKDVADDPASDTKTFTTPSTCTDDLEKRVFWVGSAVFSANVRKETGETDPIAGFMKLAAKAGVDLSPPKTVFLSEGKGTLFVYASKRDMESIKRIVDDLHCPPTQFHIKARFIEVPKTFFSSAAANSLPPGLTNGGILTAKEMKSVLRLLKSQNGTEELAEPELVTIAGRHTQMRATKLQEVVTNYIAKPNPDHPAELAISPQTAQVQTGPILDVFPLAFADGHSIALNAIADLIQFFGYASPQGLPISYATDPAGQRVPLPTSLPAFQVCEAKGLNTVFYDGQTLVLFPEPVRSLIFDPDKKRQELITRSIQQAEKDDNVEYGNKVLLVLVTATLIDSAGNRIHTNDQMPFAQASAPQQSP